MKLLKTSIIYENPLPILKSIQSFFPSLCEIEGGSVLVKTDVDAMGIKETIKNLVNKW